MRRPPLALFAVAAATIAAATAAAPATPIDTATTGASTDASAPAAATPGAQASPRDTARGTIGGATVLVDYGRPSKRGRTIFAADGLVPFGKVWRTGANQATTLVASQDVMIGGARVPAGTYTLYTIPDPEEWHLVINKQTGQWGTVYDQAQDLVHVAMPVTTLAAPVEQLTIVVEPAALVVRWDTMQASVPLAPAR